LLRRVCVIIFDDPEKIGWGLVVRQLVEKVEGLEVLLLNLQPQNETEQKMLNIQEAAAFLNITVAALYSLVSRKDIPVNKPGKRLYFDKNELNEWIRSGKKKTATAMNKRLPFSRRFLMVTLGIQPPLR
jgi:excisionase family DNA binding protein